MKIFNQYLDWVEKENLEIEQVGYNDLLLFMKYSQQIGRSQSTIRHYIGVVKHYYDLLAREGSVPVNPAVDIKVRGVKRKMLYHILQPHELHQLYNQFDDPSLKGKRNKVIVGLLVYQGLRSEELVQLEVNHILLREGKIDVPGGVRRNGRIMQLESHQVMDLYDYILAVRPKILEVSKQVTGKLLVSPSGGSTIGNFTNGIMRRLRQTNTVVQNTKQLRASVIVKWLKAYNLREVQYLAGHRYISSTEMYLQNDVEGLKEEIQQYHPLG